MKERTMATTKVSRTEPVLDPTAGGPAGQCTPEGRVTRSLLGYGVLAGPFYVGVSLAQATVRDGFDLTRHDWSLLANGPGGWVQSANLLLTGLMVVAAAIGFRRALRGGVGQTWVPRLLALYGLGLSGAGIFRADPMAGFPSGTPEGPPVQVTAHGMLHLAFAGVGFFALAAATFAMARRYSNEGRRGRTVFSVATGAGFLGAFAAITSGSSSPAVVLSFTAAVLLVFGWLSGTSIDLYRHVR
jgi:hypothetical membrane protein